VQKFLYSQYTSFFAADNIANIFLIDLQDLNFFHIWSGTLIQKRSPWR